MLYQSNNSYLTHNSLNDPFLDFRPIADYKTQLASPTNPFIQNPTSRRPTSTTEIESLELRYFTPPPETQNPTSKFPTVTTEINNLTSRFFTPQDETENSASRFFNSHSETFNDTLIIPKPTDAIQPQGQVTPPKIRRRLLNRRRHKLDFDPASSPNSTPNFITSINGDHHHHHNDHQHPVSPHIKNDPNSNLVKNDEEIEDDEQSSNQPLRMVQRNPSAYQVKRTNTNRRVPPSSQNSSAPQSSRSHSHPPRLSNTTDGNQIAPLPVSSTISSSHRIRHPSNHPQRSSSSSSGPRPLVTPARSSSRRVVSSLSISAVEKDHGGEYKCVATSSQGKAEQTVKLAVIPRKRILNFTDFKLYGYIILT